MDVETLIQKLKPLMPEQAEHWQRVREFAHPELKSLIDSQVHSAAHQVLGDFRNKLLLSLPPRNAARGEIHLGTVLYEKEKWPVGISRSELLQNLAIFGRSGAGKTNVAFHILQQLAEKKIPFVFLDWKRTGRHLLPLLKAKVNVYTPGRSLSPFVLNPFVVPPGVEANVYVNQVVDVLADAYTLGDGAKSVLQKALMACYRRGEHAPSASELLQEVAALPNRQRVREWKISVERALESLDFAGLAGTGTQSRDALARSLLEGYTIVELNGLSSNAKRFLIPLLCFWLYSVRLGNAEREKLSLVILIEEAHHLLYKKEKRAGESLMELLLRQCREFGVGIIVVDQHPHLISTAALGNTYTTLCLNQKDPADVSKAASVCLVPEADKQHFSMLPVGQGVVKLQDRWRKPFLVQFPHVDIPKGLVTDGVLQALISRKTTLSGLRSSLALKSAGDGRSRVSDKVLDKENVEFLRDVVEHPDDGVDARYKRLGWSAERGHRVKSFLLREGVLEEQEVAVGRTRRRLLRVTSRARDEFGLSSGDVDGASIAHEYWKRSYSRRFEDAGYRVELEAPRPTAVGGNVDVLATRASESVAVEVETGKSDVVDNVTRDLRSGFSRVVVVATDNKALQRIERQLARASLIVPSRVRVVLRDELPPEVGGSVNHGDAGEGGAP